MTDHNDTALPSDPSVAESDLQQRVEDLQAEVAQLQLARALDERLFESDAIDLDTARLLANQALDAMPEPDVDEAIDDLRRRKPWLFARRSRPAGAQSPHATDAASPHVHTLTDAAERAGATGRRTDLLKYLRLRRAAG